jgi:hypothetical protein
MTAHAGDAIARVAFGPVARCPTAVLCPENCDSERSLEGCSFHPKKIVPSAIAWRPWVFAPEPRTQFNSIYALLAQISPAAAMTLSISNNK